MSNTTGSQIYNQSMNGLISIENADTIQVYELDAEIITTDNLTVNNSATINSLSLSTLSSNLIQAGTNIISQTGTGTNILKNTNFNGNVAVSGNLTIDGDLIYDHVNIDVDNLIVRDSALFECNTNVNGNFRVAGLLKIGLDDPAGGTGDTATIEYVSKNVPNQEFTVLRINTTNDLGDDINLNPSGRVGIKTDNPIEELHVNGGCYIHTDLTVQNNATITNDLRVNNLLKIGIDDPASGSGDTATIEYRSYNIGTEGTVLRLNTTNDANDNINLNPSGKVGIKTDTPVATLDVNGDCYINTILTSGGDCYINGSLAVANVLRTYPTSIRYDYVYNLTTPLNVINM